MKEVALSEVKDDLSRYLRQAAKEEIVITRHGKAAGILIGFTSEVQNALPLTDVLLEFPAVGDFIGVVASVVCFGIGKYLNIALF